MVPYGFYSMYFMQTGAKAEQEEEIKGGTEQRNVV